MRVTVLLFLIVCLFFPAVEGTTPIESDVLTQRDLGERILVEQEGTTHRISVSNSNKRMFHLLKRAKVQLIKIDQQKQLKSSQVEPSRWSPLCIACVLDNYLKYIWGNLLSTVRIRLLFLSSHNG